MSVNAPSVEATPRRIVLVPCTDHDVYADILVYGNVDINVHKSTSVSKTMFPAHVSELHRNRDEGFEREYEVRMHACL